MDGSIRGLPLLSGPAPLIEEVNRHGCRKCGKEFGLFTRSRNCNHCGFLYCMSCSDHQALMAREQGEPGYDVVQVCAYCIEKLTITASGRSQLKSLSVAQLRNYLKAYSLPAPTNVLEKDDIVNAVLAARNSNGCLPAQHEEYYRKHSVPNKSPERRSRSLFSRMTGVDTSLPPTPPPRPTAAPPRTNQQTRPQGTRTAPPRPQQARPTPPSQYTAPTSNPYRYRPPPSNPPPATRPRPNPAPAQAAPPPPPRPSTPPVPSIEELLTFSSEQLHALSVGSLKAVLFENHVNAGQILEKEDLVNKVNILLDAERRERAREELIRAAEEQAYQEQQAALREQFRLREQEREREREAQEEQRATTSDHPVTPSEPLAIGDVEMSDDVEEHEHDDHDRDHDYADEESHVGADGQEHDGELKPASSPEAVAKVSSSPPKSSYIPPPTLERSGLCVICQDEEANIVIVDCGHLAMCRSCSELVMNTNRECPLCRTRIVTPQRLLRVFKT